jgi:hypothetical protein
MAKNGGTQQCNLSWMHTDHNWTDSDGTTYRYPGIWPHDPKPQK